MAYALRLRSIVVAGVIVTGVCLLGVGCKSNSIASTTNNGGATIGPSGGIVPGPDSVELRIPAGALTADTAFEIAVAEPGQYPPLSGQTVSGKVYAFLPHGQKFLTPAIVALPNVSGSTSGVSALHADPNGAWTTVSATVSASDVEITVPSLSFYAVGSSNTQNPDSGMSCSGRGPVGGAPTGTVSFTMGGTIPATFFQSGNAMSVDTSMIIDGLASSSSGGSKNFGITFTTFGQACGLAKNNDTKIGGSTVTIATMSTPAGPMTIPPTMLMVSGSQLPSNTQPGACGGNGATGSPGNMGTGLTITAIDGSHVSGSFDVYAGGVELKGTFDVPMCPTDMTVMPACCVP
jgi:hypothetical protein